MDLEKRVEEAINVVGAHEDLERFRVLIHVVGHLRDRDCWLLLSDSLIEEETLDTDTDVGFSNYDSLGSLPVTIEISDRCGEISICVTNSGVEQIGERNIQSCPNSVLEEASNSTNEEHFSSGGEISDEIAPQLDVDVKAVDVTLNIDSGHVGNDVTAGKDLLGE